MSLPGLIALILWAGMWAVGGYLLVRRAYNLRPNEQILAGIATGLVVENWLSNLIAHLASLPLASWLAAALVLAAGAACCWPFKDLRQVRLQRVPIWQLLAFLGLFTAATAIGRGLALFDDYQNLPMTSILATGDIPPHFALDPSISFGYHYFTLLFAAQLVRISSLDVWTALDVTRGLALALSVTLIGVWVQRITTSRLGGLVGGVVYAFGMGSRWLLTLLPGGLVESISPQINMIGTGLASGPQFSKALAGIWVIEGDLPQHWPFAFISGIFRPPVMSFDGTGQMWPMIAFLLLLTANRWRGWRGWVLTTIFLAALGLLGEAGVVMGLAAWGLIAVGYAVRHRSLRLPGNLWAWIAAEAVSLSFILLQGGVFTDLLLSKLHGLTGAAGQTYFNFNFPFTFPPQVMSEQLGTLSLFNPAQLLVALCEIGPVFLVFPLVCIWCIKALRSGSWYLAAVSLTGVLGLGAFFFQYAGSAGLSATVRIQWLLFGACQTFAVPLVWIWARKRSLAIKALALLAGLVMVFGGIVDFGFELPAILHPIPSTFIKSLDVLAMHDYWNRLEPDALVFDPDVFRSPTLFGRKTNASSSWYNQSPEFAGLVAAPDPINLRAYGFSYAYIDRGYFSKLSPELQQKFSAACVQTVKEYTNSDGDFRRLLDIKNCQ